MVLHLEGQRFGRLVAIEVVGRQDAKRVWRCACDCGGETKANSRALVSGNTKSCGCWRKEAFLTHGHARPRSPTYISWYAMLRRCKVTTPHHWRTYGSRGIKVCRRWHKFENFLADMGERPPGKTLDRIDNDLGYEPSNCRWATQSEQVRNRRK